MDGGCTRHAIPVPAFFLEATSFSGYRVSISHNQYSSITLITSVTVVFLVDFGSPHIGVISFQGNHVLLVTIDSG